MDTLEHDIVKAEAARWCARLSAHDCLAQERLDCENWQASDPEHAAAFAEVANIDAQTRALARMDPRMDHRMRQLAERAFAAGTTLHDVSVASDRDAMLVRPDKKSPQAAHSTKTNQKSNHRKASLVSLAVAASIALVTVVVWRIAPWSNQALEPLALEAPSQTMRHVTLEDGSVVHLDAGSKLIVSMTKSERTLQLVQGRAMFDVAHDVNRPFSVTSGGTRTVALGTRFEVRQQDHQTIVTLAQGSVSVSDVSDAESNSQRLNRSIGKSQWQERLKPGEQITVDANQERHRQNVDVQLFTSWSRGWLAFRAAPLSEALREINRYSSKQVLLGDASLSDLTVAGSFIAGDSESIVNAIAEVLPIRVVDGGQHEIILFKRYNN